jgi:hypothetical protein
MVLYCLCPTLEHLLSIVEKDLKYPEISVVFRVRPKCYEHPPMVKRQIDRSDPNLLLVVVGASVSRADGVAFTDRDGKDVLNISPSGCVVVR